MVVVVGDEGDRRRDSEVFRARAVSYGLTSYSSTGDGD